MEDLESAVTEAQYRVCLEHLRGVKCPTCDAPKFAYHCFDRRCYFALPEEMRQTLWLDRTTPDNLAKWVRAYLAAKAFLREMGRENICA